MDQDLCFIATQYVTIDITLISMMIFMRETSAIPWLICCSLVAVILAGACTAAIDPFRHSDISVKAVLQHGGGLYCVTLSHYEAVTWHMKRSIQM